MNLDTAKTTLLAPHDLETAKLERVFGTLAAHKVDYADLYFQYSRYEGWSLEEGIVKSGSFNIDQGVGVRAVSGEKTAFAYSDDISLDALQDAAESDPRDRAPGQAAPSARSHQSKRAAAAVSRRTIRWRRSTDAEGGAAREARAQCARARPARHAGDGAVSAANTKWCWSRAATA